MRIVIIAGWYPSKIYPTNGDFIMYQTQALIDKKIDAKVLFCDLDFRYGFSTKTIVLKNSFAIENDVPTYRRTGFFPPRRHSWVLREWLKQFDILFRYFLEREEKPQLFHAHTFFGAIAARYLSKKYNIPYVVTLHSSAFLYGSTPKWLGSILRDALNGANNVFAVSSYLKNVLIGRYMDKKVEVIPNFIDVNLFCPSPDCPQRNQYFKFIHVGDLLPVKRQHLLIEAFSILHENYPNARLQIIGDGLLRKKLTKFVRKKELDSIINFTGHQSQKEVATHLQNADAFVLTSEKETFGIVVIEAMSCGLPVLSTRCGGVEDLIFPFNGLFFNADSPHQMADDMLHFISNYGSFHAETIRAFIKENFSKEYVAERLKIIYENIIT